MDDLFLYNHIKKAIKQHKNFSKDTDEGNFAQKYCRRELMKKKLNVNNLSSSDKSSNRMKNLMRNFSHVDTYIDLNDLLFSINLIRSKQQAQKHSQKVQQNQRVSRLLKIKKYGHNDSINPLTNLSSLNSQTSSPQLNSIESLKDKVRIQINEMMKRNNQTETRDLDQLIQNLQIQSDLLNSFLKNNSGNYISYLNQQLKKIQKDEQIDGQACPDNWRIFKQLTQTLNQPNQKDDKKEYFRSTNLNSKEKKQENELLHKITTFLQIALENEHKQKWATKQMRKFRSTHGSFRFKNSDAQRDNFFLKGIQIQKQNKQVFDNQSNTRKNLQKNSVFMKKIKSQERNIFGKKSLYKQKLNLSHLNSFQQNKNNKKYEDNQNFQQKQAMESSFKIFDRKDGQIRKTAPVNQSKSIVTLDKQSNQRQCQVYRQIKYSQQFLKKPSPVLKIKKQYQLNKKRKNRDYDFISPQRTFIPKSSFFEQSRNAGFQKNSKKLGLQSSFWSASLGDTVQNTFKSQIQKNSSFQAQRVEPVTKQQFLSKPTSGKVSKTSQSFTFKNRNKKQLILKKIQSFIGQVNNEQKISRQQNQYYNSAINYLHDLSKTAYKNYQPQALAGEQQIDELKKFVNNMNPSLRRNHPIAGTFKRGMP